MGLRLVERDREIMWEVSRWRFLLGRQIRLLCGFAGQRACDRRLAKLIEAGYLRRDYRIYGVPGLYSVTKQAVNIFNLDYVSAEPRIDQIEHDIAAVDTAIYLIHKGINKKYITTERDLKHLDGFGSPKHQPDFVYAVDDKSYCVEVELSVKKQATLEKNIKANYLKYDLQQWVVPESRVKIMQYINTLESKYTNIEVIKFEEVQQYVKSL